MFRNGFCKRKVVFSDSITIFQEKLPHDVTWPQTYRKIYKILKK